MRSKLIYDKQQHACSKLFLRLKIVCLLLIIGFNSQAQSIQDTIINLFNSFPKNAKVWKSDIHNDATLKPLVIVFPGQGESNGPASNLLLYGPFNKINAGLLPYFNINGQTVKPIFVTIQMGDFPTFATTHDAVMRIKSHYASITDTGRVYIIGYSQGGQACNYMIDDTAWCREVTAVLNYQGVSIGTGGASQMGSKFATRNGKAWMIEGASDLRDLKAIADSMNVYKPGSGRYTLITSGDGTTHSSPGFNRISDTTYKPNGDGLNIYTWLLRQDRAAIAADAGADQTINLPGSTSTTLNGSGTGTITSYLWEQTAGPTATIVSPSSATTSITGMTTAAIRTFRLTVSDGTNTATDEVTITSEYAVSTVQITVNNRWLFDTNGRNGKGLRGYFDGNLLTNFDISKISEAVGGPLWKSWLVLPYIARGVKIEHYDNFDAGTITVNAYKADKTFLKSYTLIKSGAAVWNTLLLNDVDSVRFLEFQLTDPAVGVFEMRVFGTNIAAASSIYRNETILPITDPGSFAFGMCGLDNRLAQFDTTSQAKILPKTARTTRVGYEGPRFQFFTQGYKKPLTAPLWVGRFGDDHIRTRLFDFADTFNLKSQFYHVGGTFDNIDSTYLAGLSNPAANNSFLADPWNNFKFIPPGADSLNPASWAGFRRMWKGLVYLYGTNTSAPLGDLRFYVNNSDTLSGNKSPGQGGADVFEVGNEWSRDFGGVRAWHSPQVNYTALREAWLGGHESDPNAKIYCGAVTYMDTTYWKAMFFHHYWNYGTEVFPADGFCFNIYQNDFYDGQGGGPSSSAISPERWKFAKRLADMKVIFDSIFPNKAVRITETGVAWADDSPFDANAIGARSEQDVAADWELRIYAATQIVPLTETVFYYAAFADGSANFSTMTTTVDYFGLPVGAIVTKMGYALANQLTVEKDYNYFADVVQNGDSTGSWITRKAHATNSNKKVFKVWRGTSTGSTAAINVPVGAGASSAVLYTTDYSKYDPIATPATIAGQNVALTATEQMQWLEVTYGAAAPRVYKYPVRPLRKRKWYPAD